MYRALAPTADVRESRYDDPKDLAYRRYEQEVREYRRASRQRAARLARIDAAIDASIGAEEGSAATNFEVEQTDPRFVPGAAEIYYDVKEHTNFPRAYYGTKNMWIEFPTLVGKGRGRSGTLWNW